MRQTKLFFVYRASTRNVGSTLMRAHQLSAIVAPHLPQFELKLRGFAKPAWQQVLWSAAIPRGSVLFFTKSAARALTGAAIERLKSRRCTLLLDIVDTPRAYLPRWHPGVDAYLSPSITGAELLSQRLAETCADAQSVPRVRVLLHTGDARLYTMSEPVPGDRLRPVYWGKPGNSFWTDEIAKRVALMDASDKDKADHSIDRLKSYNFHYCVRAEDDHERIVPFTKGAVAALRGSPVVVGRQTQDAEALLGDTYPYWVERLDQGCVLDAIENARLDFGGARWKEAVGHMKAFADRLSPAELATSLGTIIQEARDRK